MARPGSDALQFGAIFALANALMYGSVTVAVRGMAKTEAAPTLLMWQMATVAVFHALLLGFGFATPTAVDAVMLVASGAANAFGQYMWTKALSLAPATVVSPFYYTLLAWSAGIGFLVWGDVPSMPLVAGTCVVVSAGLALMLREAGATGSFLRPHWRRNASATPRES